MEMIGGMGMEGFMFYWLFWIFWILTTFFMNKQRERVFLSLWLLLAIILSIHSVTLLNITISLSGILILLTSYFMMGRQKGFTGIYIIITTFMMMLAYTTFHLFELYDPVWLIFNRQFMLAIILTYLALLLHHNFRLQVLTVLAGSVHGEILNALIFQRLNPMPTIGAYTFLDCVAMTTAVLLAISGFKKVSFYFETHIKHIEREKQKQS